MRQRCCRQSMNPHPPRQRMEISSLRSIIITIITIITANIAGMRPASSWFLADIVTIIITTTIITASIVGTIEVALTNNEKKGLRALFA